MAEPPLAVAPPVAPPEPPDAVVPRYGDRGTPEVAVGLGYSASGLIGGAGFRYFVADAVAIGGEVTIVHGTGTSPSYFLVLPSLRLVPLRTPSFALAVTGQAGPMLVFQHDDGWVAGGELSLVFAVGRGTNLEVGYQVLRLLPASFCADFSSCYLQGPVFGIYFGL